jgi:transcriptional regulator with XRE-family HTH domain
MSKKLMNTSERRAFVEELAVTSVALAIADAIQRAQLTQRELAARLGVSEARISQILAATSNPTIKTLARLADVLGRELHVALGHDVHVPEQRLEWQIADEHWNCLGVAAAVDVNEEEQYDSVAA